MIRHWWVKLVAKMFSSYRSRLEPKLPSFLPLEEFKQHGFDLERMRICGKKMAVSDVEYVFNKIKNFPKNGLTPIQSIATKNILLEFNLMEEGIVLNKYTHDFDVFTDLLNRRRKAFEEQKKLMAEYEDALPEIKRVTDMNGVETRVQ